MIKKILFLILILINYSSVAVFARVGDVFTDSEKQFSFTITSDQTDLKAVEISAYSESSLIGDVTIPSWINGYKVTSIAKGAFRSCTQIKSITIPYTVKNIYSYAFIGCGQLRKIIYTGSLDDWCSIYVDGDLFPVYEQFPDCPGYDLVINGTVVTEVEIPLTSGVRGLLFRGCTSIETVKIPEGIESIPSYAFSYCPNLKTIYLPVSLKKCDSNAFGEFSTQTNLENVYYAGKIADWCNISFPITGSRLNPLENAEHFYCNNEEIIDLVIDENIKAIMPNCFKGYKGLKSLTIKDGLIEIPSGCFSGCSELSYLNLGNSVTTIGSSAFSSCAITELILPDQVTSIGRYAFDNCKDLVFIKFSNNIKYLDYKSFAYCEKLKAVNLPYGLEEIKEDAFEGCYNMSYLYIPETVINIEQRGTFSYSGTLGEYQEIYLDTSTPVKAEKEVFHDWSYQNTVLYVRAEALDAAKITEPWMYFENIEVCDFSKNQPYIYNKVILNYDFNEDETATVVNYVSSINDWKLKLEIPSEIFRNGKYFKVTEIGPKAFYDSAFGSIVLPNTIRSIGTEAFRSTNRLEHINIPDNLYVIDSMAFYGSGITEIELHENMEIKERAFSSSYLKKLILPANIKLESGVFSRISTLEEVCLSDSIKQVSKSLFSGCKSLKQIKLGESVEEIGDHAFSECSSIEYIAFPENLNSIGNYAFSGCEALKNIEFGSSLNIIGDYAFSSCNNLKQITIPGTVTKFKSAFTNCKGLESVIIENGCKKIDEYAFDRCESLKSVYIPNSVTDIHYYAFTECTSLEQITIPPSVTKVWSDAFNKCNALNVLNIGYGIKFMFFSGLENLKTINITAQTPPELYDLSEVKYKDIEINIQDQDGNVVSKYIDNDWKNKWKNFENYSNLVIPEKIISSTDSILTYEPGGKAQLLVTLFPTETTLQDLYWHSTNPQVAKVDRNGLVLFQDISDEEFQECKIIVSTMYFNGPKYEFVVRPQISVKKISLNKEFSELIIGQKETLTVMLEPENATDKTIVWSSSNDDIVTVSEDGVVTAISVGEATITATCGEATATCKITVSPCLVESIELDCSKWNGFPGESFTISATVSPDNAIDKTVIWNSSDPGVATVDETGLVIAVKPGSALITAITSNGLTATCEVTVLPILVESITLDPNIIQGIIGEVFVIKASVLPEDASNPNIYWESGNTNVATVDQDGNVKINEEGSSRIFAYATDGSNVSGECFILGTSGMESILTECGNHISIYTPSGLLIKKDCTLEDLKNLLPGIYIFKSEKKTVSVMIH